jgi:hypothetical protein
VAIISIKDKGVSFVGIRERIMFQRYSLSVAILIFVAGVAVGNATDSADSSGNVPNRNTPQKLQEAWLQFHEKDLCQEVDAIFDFSGSGMEVHGRFESDKGLQKFERLFESLKRSFPVELHLTRAESEKKEKEEEEENPPPSLWQNLELRANLGENIESIGGQTVEERLQRTGSPMPDYSSPLMKQRVKIFAEQTLNLNKRMRQYASDLEALAAVAYDRGRSHDVQSKALVVCTKHAQSLDRQIVKLTASLVLAFPLSEKKKRVSLVEDPAISGIKDPMGKAAQLSAAVQKVSQRVHQFIYPEGYTVKLDDLRHPSLLQALDVLRGLVLDFKKSLGQSVHKK